MKRFEVYPRVGVGPIKLGATRSAVREALATVSVKFIRERGTQDFFEYGIHLEYDDDGTASFIGLGSHREITLILYGVDLFDTEAKQVFELMSQQDKSGVHIFSPLEYTFPGQILSLYEADSQYDHRKSESREIWGQIGVGDIRYLNAILKIQKGQLNPTRPKK
jgi:hypothetical protein